MERAEEEEIFLKGAFCKLDFFADFVRMAFGLFLELGIKDKHDAGW